MKAKNHLIGEISNRKATLEMLPGGIVDVLSEYIDLLGDRNSESFSFCVIFRDSSKDRQTKNRPVKTVKTENKCFEIIGKCRKGHTAAARLPC